jgi:histidinol-phosphatase (PHP family)
MLEHMQLTDTHTHTWYSGHGEGTPADLLTVAISKGLTTIAITEHLTLPTSIDPSGEYSLLPEQVMPYRQEVLAAQAANPGIEVLLGTEVDWRQGAEDFILEHLGLQPVKTATDNGTGSSNDASSSSSSLKEPYQLVIGSVHALTGEDDDPLSFWPFDTDTEIEGWHQRGLRYVWDSYLKLWLNAVFSTIPFDIMGHPDLPKKLGFAPDFDAAPYWSQMAEAAATRGVMIELNTAGLYAPCAEVYPGPALLTEFCRAGVPCTISSDAHAPGNVGRDYAVAVRAMLDAGYKVVTVPTSDGGRREVAIA